jgi:uncharacterized surface protein with fasciclin (FAS1) repeats
MTMKTSFLLSAAALATALSVSSLHAGSCGASATTAKASGDYSACSSGSKSIVSVASEAGNFKTLVAAIQAAGLAETLQGDGPFTVFAPTDAAFAKLPAGTVENLLKPENRDKLVAILTYHVVPGKVMAADVKTSKAATVNGQKLDIKVANGKVTVDGAQVVATDVAAGNGVIHVIDTVVLPM